jgi:hypothetical protein
LPKRVLAALGAVGVSPGQIGDYVSGRSVPGFETGMKLKAYLKKMRRKKRP